MVMVLPLTPSQAPRRSRRLPAEPSGDESIASHSSRHSSRSIPSKLLVPDLRSPSSQPTPVATPRSGALPMPPTAVPVQRSASSRRERSTDFCMGERTWLEDWVSVQHFAEIDSTQSYVEREHRSFDQHRLTVVSTDHQSEAPDSSVHGWHVMRGKCALLSFFGRFPPECSVKFTKDNAPNAAKVLAITAVDILKQTVMGCSDLDGQRLYFGLKWPHDIMVNRRKIGAVVGNIVPYEGQPGAVIVGIHVDINTPLVDLEDSGVSDSSTSLRAETGKIFSIEDFREKLIFRFAANLRTFFKDGFKVFMEAVNQADVLKGTRVKFGMRNGIKVDGTFEGVNSAGHVVLKQDSGEVHSYVPPDRTGNQSNRSSREQEHLLEESDTGNEGYRHQGRLRTTRSSLPAPLPEAPQGRQHTPQRCRSTSCSGQRSSKFHEQLSYELPSGNVQINIRRRAASEDRRQSHSSASKPRCSSSVSEGVQSPHSSSGGDAAAVRTPSRRRWASRYQSAMPVASSAESGAGGSRRPSQTLPSPPEWDDVPRAEPPPMYTPTLMPRNSMRREGHTFEATPEFQSDTPTARSPVQAMTIPPLPLQTAPPVQPFSPPPPPPSQTMAWQAGVVASRSASRTDWCTPSPSNSFEDVPRHSHSGPSDSDEQVGARCGTFHKVQRLAEIAASFPPPTSRLPAAPHDLHAGSSIQGSASTLEAEARPAFSQALPAVPALPAPYVVVVHPGSDQISRHLFNGAAHVLPGVAPMAPDAQAHALHLPSPPQGAEKMFVDLEALSTPPQQCPSSHSSRQNSAVSDAVSSRSFAVSQALPAPPECDASPGASFAGPMSKTRQLELAADSDPGMPSWPSWHLERKAARDTAMRKAEERAAASRTAGHIAAEREAAERAALERKAADCAAAQRAAADLLAAEAAERAAADQEAAERAAAERAEAERAARNAERAAIEHADAQRAAEQAVAEHAAEISRIIEEAAHHSERAAKEREAAEEAVKERAAAQQAAHDSIQQLAIQRAAEEQAVANRKAAERAAAEAANQVAAKRAEADLAIESANAARAAAEFARSEHEAAQSAAAERAKADFSAAEKAAEERAAHERAAVEAQEQARRERAAADLALAERRSAEEAAAEAARQAAAKRAEAECAAKDSIAAAKAAADSIRAEHEAAQRAAAQRADDHRAASERAAADLAAAEQAAIEAKRRAASELAHAQSAASERQAAEQAAAEAMEKAERARHESERAIAEHSAAERAAAERAAAQRIAADQAAAESAERIVAAKLESEKAVGEHAAAERAAAERAAAEHAAIQRVAEERAAAEQAAREATEKLAREQAAAEEAMKKRSAAEEAAAKHAAAEREAAARASAAQASAERAIAEQKAAEEVAKQAALDAAEEASLKRSAAAQAAAERAAAEEEAAKQIADARAAAEKAASEQTAAKRAAREAYEAMQRAADQQAAAERAAAERIAALQTASEHAAAEREAAELIALEQEAVKKASTEATEAKRRAADKKAAAEQLAAERAAAQQAASEYAAVEREADGRITLEKEAAKKASAEAAEAARRAEAQQAAADRAAAERAAAVQTASEHVAAEREAAERTTLEKEAAQKAALEADEAAKRAAAKKAAAEQAAAEREAAEQKVVAHTQAEREASERTLAAQAAAQKASVQAAEAASRASAETAAAERAAAERAAAEAQREAAERTVAEQTAAAERAAAERAAAEAQREAAERTMAEQAAAQKASVQAAEAASRACAERAAAERAATERAAAARKVQEAGDDHRSPRETLLGQARAVAESLSHEVDHVDQAVSEASDGRSKKVDLAGLFADSVSVTSEQYIGPETVVSGEAPSTAHEVGNISASGQHGSEFPAMRRASEPPPATTANLKPGIAPLRMEALAAHNQPYAARGAPVQSRGQFRPETLNPHDEPFAGSEASFQSRGVSAAGASTVDSPKSTAASAHHAPSISSAQLPRQTQEDAPLPTLLNPPPNRQTSNTPKVRRASSKKFDKKLESWLRKSTTPPPPVRVPPAPTPEPERSPAHAPESTATPAMPTVVSEDEDVNQLFEAIHSSVRAAGQAQRAPAPAAGHESDGSSDPTLDMINKTINESLRQADAFHRSDSFKPTKSAKPAMLGVMAAKRLQSRSRR